MPKIPPTVYKLYHRYITPALSDTSLHYMTHEIAKKVSHAGIPKVEESEAEPISEREWSNLMILDSCRHDEYERVTGKNVDHRITCGSVSREFMAANFSDGDWSDTVYVSGNLNTENHFFEDHTGRKPGDVFHEIFQVHREHWIDGEATDPEAMVEKARTAAKLFPEKRLIVHIMKPHAPFVARERDKKIDYEKASLGEVNEEEVKDAYRRNLELGLDMVSQIRESLEGRTVITSDHGELLGENNRWSHKERCSDVPLRKVPWDVISDS
jgi:hypothetical protein